MAASGMSHADIAAVLHVPWEALGILPETMMGKIEGQRIAEVLTKLGGPDPEQAERRKLFAGLAPKQQAFLCAYSECLMVTMAAAAAGVSRFTHYDWLADPEYRAKFDAAHQIGVGLLEDEAVRRARHGLVNPIFSYGKLVGHQLEYSDSLLVAKLRAELPDKYRERHELTGKDGGPVEVQVKGLTVRFIKPGETQDAS